MGRNGRPKLSVPYLCFLDGEEGGARASPPLQSSSPPLVPFAAGTKSGPVHLPLYPGDREMSLLLCYCTSPGHCSAHPNSPRRFVSAGSNGIPFWGIMGNEVFSAIEGAGVGAADFTCNYCYYTIVTLNVLTLSDSPEPAQASGLRCLG